MEESSMINRDTILIVDDVYVNLEILKALLGDRYRVLTASTGKEAIEIAKRENVDLILLDILMPDINGYEVCKQLKEFYRDKNLIIIFITLKVDEDSISFGYEIGADDYVIKPYKRKELLAKIKHHIAVKHKLDRLQFLTEYDTMTNTYNRRKFFQLANDKFKKEKHLYGVAIHILEVDKVNQVYGQKVGDRVIQNVASILKKYIKEGTILGRLSGTTFVMICTFDNLKKLEKRVDIIKTAIERDTLLIDDIKLSFKINIAFRARGEEKSLDHFLNNLYQDIGLTNLIRGRV
jgi:diguanylate cyclase (GGDEF)-like protein